MRLKKIIYLIVLILLSSLNLFGKKIITIATGPLDGSFYPIGVLFGKTIENDKYSLSIMATNDSIESLNLLIDKKVEMAFVNEDIVKMALDGNELFNKGVPFENLRSIAGLHFSYIQIITRKNSTIKNIRNLKGKKVGVGVYNSDVDLNARVIYKAFGMNYHDTYTIFANTSELIERFKKGKIDAIFTTNIIPNPLITKLKKEMNIKILSVSGKEIDKLISKYPYFSKKIIPKKIYNTDKNIETIAIRELLVTRADLFEKDIYNITKSIFDNLEEMKKENKEIQNRIFLLNSQSNIIIPFHSGAIIYYNEQY